MNVARYIPIALASVMMMSPATAAPELVGFFATGNQAFVGLRDSSNTSFAWHSVGDRFGEYEVVSFDMNTETVQLKQGTTITHLKLKASRVESAPTVSLIEQLANNGNLEMRKMLPGLRTMEARLANSVAELSDLEARAFRDEEARLKIPNLRRNIELQEKHLGFLLRAVVRSKKPVAEVEAPNKAPEPTPGAVTPRATEGDPKGRIRIQNRMRHAARQLPSWLIFDVRQKKEPRTMNPIRLLFFVVTLTSSCLAAQGKANQKKGALSSDAMTIEFAGYTTIAKENLLLLFDPQEKLTSPFLRIGQVWRGSILKSFDLKSESITLVHGGREILLRLRDSKVKEMTRMLNISRGTYTLLDETVVYSADAQLIMANGFLVSSSDGEMVSDREQKIVGGDLIVRMPKGTLKVSNGTITTKDGGPMRVTGDSIRISLDAPKDADRPNKAPEPTPGAVTPRATEGTSK